MKSLAWGLPGLVPDDAPNMWGARAIFKNGIVDIVPDRHSLSATYEPMKFMKWLQKKGLKWLEKEAKCLRGNREELVSLDDGKFHLRANTNASYGYLYITAWEDA
jgi:hypothetical protein